MNAFVDKTVDFIGKNLKKAGSNVGRFATRKFNQARADAARFALQKFQEAKDDITVNQHTAIRSLVDAASLTSLSMSQERVQSHPLLLLAAFTGYAVGLYRLNRYKQPWIDNRYPNDPTRSDPDHFNPGKMYPQRFGMLGEVGERGVTILHFLAAGATIVGKMAGDNFGDFDNTSISIGDTMHIAGLISTGQLVQKDYKRAKRIERKRQINNEFQPPHYP